MRGLRRSCRIHFPTHPSPVNNSSTNMSKTLPPIHPSEILLEEFLKPLDINPHQLAMALRVPPNRASRT